jgi:hypothetical protein
VVLAAYQSDASEVRGLGGALEPFQYQPLLLSYGTACFLLAGAVEAKEEHTASSSRRGLKRSSTFRNNTQSEPRFRA